MGTRSHVPSGIIIPIPDIFATVHTSGRVGKLGKARTRRLTAESSLAARDHGTVRGTIVLVPVGQGTGVQACGLAPRRIVIGVEKVQPVASRGRRRGRTGKLADARSAHLPSVGTLAACNHRGVGGTIVLVLEREGELVETPGLAPRRFVIGVEEIGQPATLRGRCRGRTGKLGDAVSRHLSAVSGLAAR